MIDAVMFAALGFLVASLLALMLAPPLWHRAVRLTTRRIEATLPMSVTDIQADKDQLRAEFAIELRRVEVALEKAKDKAARELVNANKRRVENALLNEALGGAKGQLQENENANRVLEQTIKRRLPDLEGRIKAAKEAIAELESANAELRKTVESQAAALKEARSAVQSQRGDIEGLRVALDGGGRVMRVGKSDPAPTPENQRLNVELSRLKEEFARQKTTSEENELLRRELDKLALQILAIAQTPSDPSEPPASFFPHPPAPQEPVAYGANGGNGTQTPEPETEPQFEPEPAVEDIQATQAEAPEEAQAETETEPRLPLAKRLAARREKRRAEAAAAAKGRGQSLSDRLKGIPADAPETG
jgi:hypothetical protein